MPYDPVVEDLENLIRVHKWERAFQDAIDAANKSGVAEMRGLSTTREYLDFINGLLRWIPSENIQGTDIYNHLGKFYFVLDQQPVIGLQNAIRPVQGTPVPTPLSAWMVRFADAMGEFLDKEESITPESLASFRASPGYNMSDYIEPRGGWRTFNQFFARSFKPGYRPVAAISDPDVIVSPADSTFDGQWEIRRDSHVTLKGLHWEIRELLAGSPYEDHFVNGQFMHAFLGTSDYHRQHAPVGGTILEARVIPGQVYLQVVSEAIDTKNSDTTNNEAKGAGAKRLKTIRGLGLPDDPGYQFAQARGLIVLDTPIGLVAVLPIGMSQVSSVIITAEVGTTVRKGEELSYFQFGGSDIVMLFQARSNVSITAQVGVHYKMGTRIAQAFPVGA